MADEIYIGDTGALYFWQHHCRGCVITYRKEKTRI